MENTTAEERADAFARGMNPGRTVTPVGSAEATDRRMAVVYEYEVSDSPNYYVIQRSDANVMAGCWNNLDGIADLIARL